MNLTQWQPTPSGGSPNPLADAAPVELIPDAETLLAERPLAIGTGTDLNYTEVIGDSGVGGGTGSGEGNADGEGFFGLDLTGDRIVFVVDASRSMNAPYPGEAKNRLGRVKIEIYNTVRKMTADQKFFVVFFNTEPIPMPARDMIPAEPAIMQPYMEWIFKLKAQGQTNPESALLMALRLRPDKVYFLTDGDFSYRSVRSVREVNRGRVPIHTVGSAAKRARPISGRSPRTARRPTSTFPPRRTPWHPIRSRPNCGERQSGRSRSGEAAVNQLSGASRPPARQNSRAEPYSSAAAPPASASSPEALAARICSFSSCRMEGFSSR